MIAIIKYNAGNVQSVRNALNRLGIKNIITDNVYEIKNADKVILPGVGEASSAMAYLKSNNIGSRIMYPPINKQQAYDVEGEHIVSNEIGVAGLWLPSSSKLTNDQIDFICDHIIKFYER